MGADHGRVPRRNVRTFAQRAEQQRAGHQSHHLQAAV